jgi:branched-chain amino acid transport system permease protein
VVGFSIVIALSLWLLLDKTRLGVMIRASVDDRQMAQGIGVPASTLFTVVFVLGTALAGIGGVLAAPILSVYPGLDADMLPLALVVVILGGLGSLAGAFVGSFLIGFVYSFGQVLFPDLAYIILFLPMVVILAVRPRGLFGRITA